MLDSFAAPKRIGLWDNPLVPGGFDALIADVSIDPAGVTSLAHDVVALPASAREAVMQHPLVIEGAIYPMNPSSLVAARALDAQPGDEVLDLAAAPGGKSLVLASALTVDGEATGRLACVEPVKPRFHRLRANLERCGVRQVDTYLRDGRGVGRAVPERFDRVLLDAPCSSEARVRLDEPDSWRHWSPRKIKECARKQRGLLRSAFAALKPGGTLVYCTCSFAPEENEAIVEGLLTREPGARLVPVELTIDAPTRPPVSAWGRNRYALEHAHRVLPDALWDGFFIARIRKALKD